MGIELPGDPIKSAVSGVISGAFGFITDLVKEFHLSPEKAAELQQRAEDRAAKASSEILDLVKGQLEINKVEAASSSIFVAGWRPWTGWIAGTSLGVYYIPRAIITVMAWSVHCYYAIKAGQPLPAYPPFDVSELATLLGGMLGLAGLRTFERNQGVQRDTHR